MNKWMNDLCLYVLCGAINLKLENIFKTENAKTFKSLKWKMFKLCWLL